MLRSARTYSDLCSASALLRIKTVVIAVALGGLCMQKLWLLWCNECNVCWGLHQSPSILPRRRKSTLSLWALLELLVSYILPNGLVWREVQYMKCWNSFSVQLCVLLSCLGHVASPWGSHRVYSPGCLSSLPLQHMCWYTWAQLPCSSFSTIALNTDS